MDGIEIAGDPSRLVVGPGARWPTGSAYPLFVSLYSGAVRVGPDVLFGFGVKLLCGHHDYARLGQQRHFHYTGGFDITIGEGVWVASFALVLGPCVIGEHAVIGAGSVVTRDVPARQVWAGNPARFLKAIDGP